MSLWAGSGGSGGLTDANIYIYLINGDTLPTTLGEPVYFQMDGSGIVQEFGTTNGVIGVWAEEGILPGLVGKVLINGVSDIHCQYAVNVGDTIVPNNKNISYNILGSKAFYTFSLYENMDATIDNVFTLFFDVSGLPVFSVEIDAGDTQAIMLDKISSIVIPGYVMSTSTRAGFVDITWTAVDIGQKFNIYYATVDDANDDWWQYAELNYEYGSEPNLAAYETGRFRLGQATAPSSGTLNITLPGEVSPISILVTAGDTRQAINDAIIALAPITYNLVQPTVSTAVYYYATQIGAKYSNLIFDAGETGLTNTGGFTWYTQGANEVTDISWGCTTGSFNPFATSLESSIEEGDVLCYVIGSLKQDFNASSSSIESSDEIQVPALDNWLIYTMSGTAEVNTIVGFGQLPPPIFHIIPTGIWTTGINGNIAVATTSIVNKPMTFFYNSSDNKYYPSY